MTSRRLALLVAAAGAVLLAGGAAGLLRDGGEPVAAGRAGGQCDLYASPDGDDGATGRAADPLRSVQGLVDALTPGETGCLLGGSFEGDVTMTSPAITLTGAPGAEATLIGRLEIKDSADDVTVSRLRIDGAPSSEVTIQVFGDRVHLLGNEVTNEDKDICILVGDSDYGVAHDFLAQGNRVHDCGSSDSEMKDHGFYVAVSRGARILDNAIYDGGEDAGWGIHLYPDADGSLIAHNVIDGNAGGIILAAEGDKSSDDNVVRDNVITNSTTTYNLEDEIEEPLHNVVEHNCFWHGRLGNMENSGGYAARRNVIADPLFVDRDAKDFRLRPGSPCAGMGLPRRS